MGKTGQPRWGIVLAGLAGVALGVAVIVLGIALFADDRGVAGMLAAGGGVVVMSACGRVIIRGATSRRR